MPGKPRTTPTASPTAPGSSGRSNAVELERVRKIYPNGFEAVRRLDLTIQEGELMVVVGPSGCGKTTVLRMVAGLEEITSGTLRIDGRVVNDVTPKQRDVAMVFQNYALYPHMTVGANIAFALRLKHLPKREIERRVEWVASMLGLTDLLEKKPAQLSGGQRQRVAMGRAIVREPRLFLMDEPLSNLDAKLRVQMRAEISRLQRHLGVATLFVTHDQTEAMTLGDRIAIMRDGVLQQLDTPQSIYDAPANVFVAEFIGSPAMNLYEARLAGTELKLGTQSIPVPETVLAARSRRLSEIEEVIVGIRPEHLKFSRNGAMTVLEGDVNLIEALGSDALVHFTTDARRVHTEARRDDPVEDSAIALPGAPAGDGVARLEPDPSLVVGQRIRLQLDPRRLYFFDPSTGLAL
jgi:multiple sugar transport system ATP-binding protein